MRSGKLLGVMLGLLLLLAGCGASRTEHSGLTLSRVRELAQKEAAPTWSDFSEYQGQETGSGLYIMVYPLDDADYSVWVGGANSEKAPMYVRLVRDDDLDDYIDLGCGDMDEFLN